MKKFIQSALAIAMVALTFSACEDVPAPFDLNYNETPAEPAAEPAGEGTAASPYNVAKALDIITAGTYTSDKVYVTGIVTKIDNIDTSYGNATYYLGDTKTATTTLEIYRGYYYNGDKFTTGNEFAVGDTLVVYGVLINYNGTKEMTQGGQIISINGKTGGSTTGGGSTVAPAGEGTAESPYNVAKALSTTTALAADTPTEEVYVAGTIVGTPNIDTTYGNATFFISDDGTENGKFTIYRSYYFNGDKYTSTSQLKAGDKVVLLGKLINFKGNTPEMNTGGKLISLNGQTSGGSTGNETGGETGGEGTTGTQMTSDLIIKGNTGSVTLDTNKYGSQDTGNESTWYTWKFNNITYKGARICVSDGTNGEGIQVQGNATDNTKQGFIINADAFGSDIKTITLVLSVAATSKYDPGFNLYAGSTAHPVTNAINATPTVTTGEKYKEYTYTFDLSSGSYRYFTIANDKVGAIYVKSVLVTLK